MRQSMTVNLRPIREDDLAGIMLVQAACYPPSMQEPEDVILSRIRVAGDTSLAAVGDEGMCGYLFAYPCMLGAASELGSRFVVAEDADTMYLHDLSVSPAAAGNGLARTLVGRLIELARERLLVHCALVSVQDTQQFWERLGFQAKPAPGPELRAVLGTYPGHARYMTRRVAG
jgi:ribosomal protein S18 acetylase RimI-like enzyme